MNADTNDIAENRPSGEAWMKTNPIDMNELLQVEELEERSAPAVPMTGRPPCLPATIVWDE